MQQQKFYYLIKCRYLGFRYHGWQKQPNGKTIQLMLEKTINYVLDGKKFKILGASRTDAMVSANRAAFELFTWEPVDLDSFLSDMNFNLPKDIELLTITQVDQKFNIIQDSKDKEYLYLFSSGEKIHPFAAPLMTYSEILLDTEKMKVAAKLFEGTHNFSSYCTKPNEATEFNRTIKLSEIEENELYTASFFPKKSYLYRVKGAGFLRYQVRWMMGALFAIGTGKIDLIDIQNSLVSDENVPVAGLAPASGLILHSIEYEQKKP